MLSLTPLLIYYLLVVSAQQIGFAQHIYSVHLCILLLIACILAPFSSNTEKALKSMRFGSSCCCTTTTTTAKILENVLLPGIGDYLFMLCLCCCAFATTLFSLLWYQSTFSFHLFVIWVSKDMSVLRNENHSFTLLLLSNIPPLSLTVCVCILFPRENFNEKKIRDKKRKVKEGWGKGKKILFLE